MQTPAQKRKILVIEGDATVRSALERYITLSGYEVVTIGSGEEGMKLVEGQKPDLILLSIALPGTDGLEILNRLREKHEQIRVVMLAGPQEILKAHHALNCGAGDFVPKPIDLPTLKRTLQINLPANR